ncbi:MAG: hypothetical protein U9Q68_08855 [Euryarchaeota archaeon]|nr:hypothetical protein [Euryarchaeota archaeon]
MARNVRPLTIFGFTHFCDTTRKGKFKLGRKTSRKKFRQTMTEMNIWLKRIRNLAQLKEWWEVLELKLLGHYRYYESEREYTIVAELLPPCRETRFQMD